MSSILKKYRKTRAQAKAELKAAKSRAKAEVKSNSKAQQRREKLLAKQEKALLKSEEKGLKERRKHEQKLAQAELEKLRAGRFNSDNVKRYAGALRIALPLALPLAYRGIVSLRERRESSQAKKSGVTREQLAQFSGHGAPLKARTHGIRNSLNAVSLPAGYRRDVRDRLTEIEGAIDNAEFMTPKQRRRAHNSINREIDALTNEIQQRVKESK